jgi:hypothetical protein
MGTKGCVVFRWRGVYYIFFNGHDSYFDFLGNQFVDEINELLLDQGRWERLKALLEKIPLRSKYNDGQQVYYSIQDSVACYSTAMYKTSKGEQGSGVWEEYVYTLDLDNNEFVVNKYGERTVQKLVFGSQLPYLLEEE